MISDWQVGKLVGWMLYCMNFYKFPINKFEVTNAILSNKDNLNAIDGKESLEEKIPETNIKDSPVEENTIDVD